MRCDEFLSQLEPYLDEQLEGAERQAWRVHLEQCASCRAAALAEDPTLAFALTIPSEATPHEVEDCVAGVAALIRQDRLNRQLQPRRRRWLAAAAALFVSIGGVTVWQLGTGDGTTSPSAGTAAVAADHEMPAPEVEVEMDGEGIRVYHFAAEGDDDTAVAFIVNPALES